MSEQELCQAEIRKNIVLVETGGELTLPLATLNKDCKFRKVWEETYDKWHPEDSKKAHRKAYKKAYYQKPEVKAHRKAHRKAYYQKPEVKAHRKAYMKAYYQKPEVKAHRKAYMKAYYQMKKEGLK